MTTDTLAGMAIRVPPHYEGPPGMVNGGWASGLTAGLLTGPDTPAGAPVEVTLTAPVPIDTPLCGELTADGARLTGPDGGVLAEARRVGAIPPPPAFVPLAAAEPAAPVTTPFPGCFVCGTRRLGGLRIAVGPVAGGDRVAGTVFAGVWTPPAAAGDLPARYVWAALDCPTGLVHVTGGARALLGRLTVAHHRTPVPGDAHVVVAAATGAERRKRFATAALYTAGGALVANSAAVWITI